MSEIRDQILATLRWLNPSEVDQLENLIARREHAMRAECDQKIRDNDSYWIKKVRAQRHINEDLTRKDAERKMNTPRRKW